jgi:putative membrane protein
MTRLCRLLAFAATFSLLLAAAALAEGQSHSQQSDTGQQQLSEQDRQWLDYAATDNQAEIQECLLAEKKAHSPAVKAFARLMVDDHINIESRLAALVNGQSVSVPNGTGQKNAKTISELESLQGEQFDRRFLTEQIKDHGDDIGKFSDEIHTTQNPNIRSYASETLPILQQHLALANAVQSSVSGHDSSK